jgi:hypothetical protein
MLHTLAHTVAVLIVLASCQCGSVFSAAAHEPGALPGQHCQLAHVALYEQHTPCCTQTPQTHACMHANVLLFPIPSNPDESALRPFLLCKFRTCLQQPRSVVSALHAVLYPMYISHGCGSNAEGSCLLRAWSGCSVITGFLQQPTSSGAIKGDIAARCPGTELHGISHA